MKVSFLFFFFSDVEGVNNYDSKILINDFSRRMGRCFGGGGGGG